MNIKVKEKCNGNVEEWIRMFRAWSEVRRKLRRIFGWENDKSRTFDPPKE